MKSAEQEWKIQMSLNMIRMPYLDHTTFGLEEEVENTNKDVVIAHPLLCPAQHIRTLAFH